MRPRKIALVACAIAIATGCGTDKKVEKGGEAAPSHPKTTTVEPEEPSECDALMASLAQAVEEGQEIDIDFLDGLGYAATAKCETIAEFEKAAANAFEPGTAKMLTDFMIRSCIGAGESVGIDDTALCQDAVANAGSVMPSDLPAGAVLVEDDFSRGCGLGWSTDRTSRVILTCRAGAYHVLVKKPDMPQNMRLFGQRRRSLAVQADAVLVKPERGEFEVHGVSCWASRSEGYLFLVGPDGSYFIMRTNEATGKRSFLKRGQSFRVNQGAGARNRIRADCVGGGARPTVLTLYVNSEKAGVARDRRGFDAFVAYGLFVGTSERNTEVEFDNFVVHAVPR